MNDDREHNRTEEQAHDDQTALLDRDDVGRLIGFSLPIESDMIAAGTNQFTQRRNE